MAGIREIKQRISSINDTRHITKAMKLISTSKLKKARKQLDDVLPFFKKTRVAIVDILSDNKDHDSRYIMKKGKKYDKRSGYLIISGDKGLAGGYNINLFKLTEKHIKDNPKKEDPILFIAGRTGREYFTSKGYEVYDDFKYPVQDPDIFRSREMSDVLTEQYDLGAFDELYIVYTDLVTSLLMQPKIVKFLPIDVEKIEERLNEESEETHVSQTGFVSMIYEPSVDEVFRVLVAKYMKGIVYGAMVESFTSELNARMMAMESATNNADDMIGELTLKYNTARQAAITQELTEIVSGATVLYD